MTAFQANSRAPAAAIPSSTSWTRFLPAAALVLSMLGLFLLRLPIVGEHYGFSADSGSYLQTRWVVLGHDNIGVNAMHWRPPLIGILLVPVTWLFGDLEGSKLLALFVSALIPVPVFVILRERGVRPWLALMAGIVGAVQPTLGGMTTGGYLSVLAAVPFLLGVHWLDQAWPWHHGAAKFNRRALDKAMACAFLVAGLNQTMTCLYFVAIAIVTAVNVGRNIPTWRQMLFWPSMFRHAIPGLISVLAMVPWLAFDVPALASGYFYADEPWLWVAEAPGAFVALWAGVAFVVWRPLWGSLCIVFAVMALFGSTNIAFNNVLHRAGFLTPLFATIGITLILEQLRGHLSAGTQRTAALVGMAAVVPLLLFGNTLWMQTARATADNVEMLTADQLSAIEWVKANVAEDEVVYSHPNGFGWWIGGLSNRAWEGTWFVAPVAKVGIQDAWKCTMGWRADCDPYELRDRYGMDVVLMDTSSWQTVRTAPPPGEWPTEIPALEKVEQWGEVSAYRWR